MRYAPAAAGVLLVSSFFSSGAAAQSAPPGTDPNRCSPQDPGACLNGVSGSVTGLDALRVSVTSPRGCTSAAGRLNAASGECDADGRGTPGKKTGLKTGRVQVAAASGATGLLPPEPSGWAVWASYGRSRFEGEVSIAPYKADLDSYRVGADRIFAQRYVGGLALAAERMDTKTRFNGGGQDADALMVMPYFMVVLSDNFSLDVNAGFGKNKIDQHRVDPANGARLVSNYDGERRFWSVTLNGSHNVDSWVLGGRVGYLHSREEQDGYTESGGPSVRTVRDRVIKLGQLFVGADVAYQVSSRFEPYASLMLRRDLTRNDGGTAGGLPNAVGNPQPTDKTGYDWTIGVRLYVQRGITASLEYMRTEGRDRFENQAINLLARFEL